MLLRERRRERTTLIPSPGGVCAVFSLPRSNSDDTARLRNRDKEKIRRADHPNFTPELRVRKKRPRSRQQVECVQLSPSWYRLVTVRTVVQLPIGTCNSSVICRIRSALRTPAGYSASHPTNRISGFLPRPSDTFGSTLPITGKPLHGISRQLEGALSTNPSSRRLPLRYAHRIPPDSPDPITRDNRNARHSRPHRLLPLASSAGLWQSR